MTGLLAAIPAKVYLLNPQPALSLCGRNWSFCPDADPQDHPLERRGRVVCLRDRCGCRGPCADSGRSHL